MVARESYTIPLSYTGTCWVTLVTHPFFWTTCLDFEEIPEDRDEVYHDDEVYYEEQDLSSTAEGVNYLVAYGAEDPEEE